MVNHIPTTLCWMYDIMYLVGTKYDPREIVQQEKKIKRSIEDIIVQLTSDTATLSVSQNDISVDDKFSVNFAYNPSIYDQLDKFVAENEERPPSNNEADVLSFKLRRIMPDIAKVEGKDKKEPIQGVSCYHYLRGFCFITMRERLYELTERLLKATNKDKMASVV